MLLVRVVINGRSVDVPAGATVLHALRTAGVGVPSLCHDDRLQPSGACRMCLVHVQGSSHLVTACTTPALDGMIVESHTSEIEDARRSALTLLASRYPAEAARRDPDHEFHRLIRAYGLEGALHDGIADQDLVDRSHPYIAVDMARCIDCYRCVRICDELQGQFVWHIRDRGLETRIRPDGPTLLDSSCVGCGACVDSCPSGALEDATVSSLGAPSNWTRTTCPYCGVGCEMEIGTRDGQVVSARPVLGAPVSKGHLCVKGRYAFGFASAEDRVTQPMIRTGDTWRRTSWNEARAFVVDRLRDLIARHGPDSIGVLGSARATNEENYLTQKLARTIIGTNNVDCCARVCHAPSAAGLKQVLGAGLATNSFDDIEVARTILICGANATESHPVVGARIKQAVRRGARLIVIDPRRIELAEHADCHLAIRPGTNVPLLNAIAHTIVHEDLCDRAFIEARVSAFDDFARAIAAWTPERAAAICGVEAEAIRRAARLYASGSPAMTLHGLGLTEHVQGTDGVMALIDLALLTGNLGTPGAGVNPLRGQNNVQGAAHMGCDPATLTGATALDAGREAFARQWGVPLPATRGLTMLEMLDAAAAGRLKGLWAIGYDVLMTNPNATETARALRALDLIIVQDLFLTETAREFGSVFLPACSSFEKEGTFMNAERRIQRVRAALPPAGASKPDWQILCEVARAMGGTGFAFTSPQDIWDEVRALCDGARGMTYARLDRGGLQWPCPADDHPGTAILHCDSFASGARAALRAIDYHATPETADADYPLLLMTGRSLYQFNAGTMTGRTRNAELRGDDVLDVSPADGERLRARDGEPVRLISRYGSAVLPLRVNTAVQTGQVFATFQIPEVRLNAVTGPHRDGAVGTPEYKVTAVRIERVAT
ncbi:MAG: formate dehydrogenase subunit alpha [Acidobacteriia bacterium]|nr:formate dehydrogenase subunit alpha [Terriglobia bacterium]